MPKRAASVTGGSSSSSSSSATEPPMKVLKTAITTAVLSSTTQKFISPILLPKTVTIYKDRLTSQKKELYKDPPVLPPSDLSIAKKIAGEPTRASNMDFKFPNLPTGCNDFTPNLSPAEILSAGAFGGTYFRSITSAVTNLKYNSADVVVDTLRPDWVEGLSKPRHLCSDMYRTEVNRYKVKCGGSLGMWESSGWVSELDPYGWFQWYCRFYQGRRCDDDVRQISRWSKCAGEKGRFRSQLSNKCLAADTDASDAKISPVIRQTLLHWGFNLTDEKLAAHAKKQKQKSKK